MGYTNYWRSKTTRPKKDIMSEAFRSDIRKIVEAANKRKIMCHLEESDTRIEVVDDLNISESFTLSTETTRSGEYEGFSYFCFCKTFECAFDAVVKCCIVAGIKAGLFEPILMFDGNRHDDSYARAVLLANMCGSDFAGFFASVPVED